MNRCSFDDWFVALLFVDIGILFSLKSRVYSGDPGDRQLDAQDSAWTAEHHNVVDEQYEGPVWAPDDTAYTR